VSIVGLMFMILFSTLKVPGAVILSITCTTFVGMNYGMGFGTSGDSGNAGKAVTDVAGYGWFDASKINWLPQMGDIPSGVLKFGQANKPVFWEAVWTFLAVELFDSFGTIVATVSKAGLYSGKDDSGKQLVNRAMAVDGFGLMLGAVIGGNSITCYIESLTGIEAGARTGFASVVTGVAFFLSLLFVAPFVGIIPDAATCCALVYVGVCSMRGLTDADGGVNFADPIQLWVTFLTIAIMGFTYSIFNGITFGFIAFSIIQLTLAGAAALSEKVPALARFLKPAAGTDTSLPHPLMVVLSSFFVFRYRYLGA